MFAASFVGALVVLCIATAMDLPCEDKNAQNYEFCDEELTIERRVSSLLSLLTSAEKIRLLGNNSPGVPRLSLPMYQWWGEALHGVASHGCCPPVMVKSTSFPQVCSLGVTFNRTLFAAVGDAIGSEALDHFYTIGDMPGLTYWSPNVNLFRDPRWGRGQEVPGEDPFLNGEYAASLIPALQFGTQNSSTRPHIAAACKHFYAYSLETSRLSFDASVEPRDAYDSYLPQFKKCVDSGVMGVMCSYNAVNGVPSCANREMLTNVLREQWGFGGYVTGDCGAVENIATTHNYTSSPEDAVKVSLEAGLDLDCGVWLQKYGLSALNQGTLSLATVNRAVANLLRVQFRIGYFDSKVAKKHYGSVENDRRQHNELALDAARQSIVLLKNGQSNNDMRLPLSIERHRTIALLGPNANATTTMQGNYHGIAPFLISPKDGLEALGVKVVYEKGCNISSNVEREVDTEEICKMIQSSDAVVLVMGLDQTVEREGLDRTSLELPGTAQDDLIKRASSCAKQTKNLPVILVVMSGGPVDLSKFKTSNNVDSIIYVGYPGQSGGQAIAEAIFGQRNPSGRLSTSVLPATFATQVSLEDMRMRPGTDDGFPGRTYRFYQGEAVYPFGFGLSFSTFEYRLSASGETGMLKIEVRNSGPIDGAHSILLFYIGPNAGEDGNPIKSLVAFDKAFVKVGETKILQFSLKTLNIDIRYLPGEHCFAAGATEDLENSICIFVESSKKPNISSGKLYWPAGIALGICALISVRHWAHGAKKVQYMQVLIFH